jgi:hypothetical protein
MSVEDHKTFNQLFNALVTQKRVKYSHLKQVDKFYEGIGRTTFQDNVAIETIQKNRIADLHLHFPRYKFDLRISVNEELPGNK